MTPQETTDRSTAARIINLRKLRPVFLRIDTHGPEFENFERPSVLSYTLLSKKGRTAGSKPLQEDDHQQYRR